MPFHFSSTSSILFELWKCGELTNLKVDPTRTISAGKVEIGAFRTYPAGYKAPDDGPSEYQTIPISKIEDFGVHCKQYVLFIFIYILLNSLYFLSNFCSIAFLLTFYLRYYPLEISYFKSSLDSALLGKLWNKYWVNTLSSSPMFAVITSHLLSIIFCRTSKRENAYICFIRTENIWHCPSMILARS